MQDTQIQSFLLLFLPQIMSYNTYDMIWYDMGNLPNLVEPNQKLQTSELGGSIKSSEVTTPVGEGLVVRPDGVRPAPWGRLQGGEPRPDH